MINRKEEIKKKGFCMGPYSETLASSPYAPTDFSKIKVGIKTLEDAVFNIGTYKQVNPTLANKETVIRAIHHSDYPKMREISNFFYKTSGIYSRLCRYMANLYRYDYFVTPYIDDEKMDKKKIVKIFHQALNFLDNFDVKKFCGDVALKVIKNGCYYGYIVSENGSTVSIQELDPNYCRTRFSIGGRPVIEFNFKYFEDNFRDYNYRMQILNLFPKDFRKGYALYKKGNLPPLFPGDSRGWYSLEVGSAFKFNMNGDDAPVFLSVIPSIIDLDEAQDLDKQKMKQRLLKIIIQKLPLDKNGELVFDVDEAKELHNNAVNMLGRAIGIDVLTTFADTEVADMSDRNTNASIDELQKIERTVYNNAGTAQMLFNTDGNMSLEKSILNDEAAMYNLLAQFENFFNYLLTPFNKKPKKYHFSLEMLGTTIYNYKEMSKIYKEQTAMGYSKMLPQIALGHSQSSILATAFFENEILELFNVFIPPLSSNTMSSESLKQNAESGQSGRKALPDDQKSEKTIQNIESMK